MSKLEVNFCSFPPKIGGACTPLATPVPTTLCCKYSEGKEDLICSYLLRRHGLVFTTISTFTSICPLRIINNMAVSSCPVTLPISAVLSKNVNNKSCLICVKSEKMCVLGHPQTSQCHKLKVKGMGTIFTFTSNVIFPV